MDRTTIERYGDELYASLLSRIPVEPLTNREPGITIDDAYQIQLRMIQRRLDVRQEVQQGLPRRGHLGGVLAVPLGDVVEAGDFVIVRADGQLRPANVVGHHVAFAVALDD